MKATTLRRPFDSKVKVTEDIFSNGFLNGFGCIMGGSATFDKMRLKRSKFKTRYVQKGGGIRGNIENIPEVQVCRSSVVNM